MSKTDAKRKARLQELIALVEASKSVSKASIKAAVTPEEYASFERALTPIASRGLLTRSERSALKGYNRLLAKADYLNSSLQRKKKYTNVERAFRFLETKVSRAYGDACEFLENSPEIWGAMDRRVRFGSHDGPDSDEPETLPRMKASGAEDSLSHYTVIKNEIADLKLQTLRGSLESVEQRCKNPLSAWNFSDRN